MRSSVGVAALPELAQMTDISKVPSRKSGQIVLSGRTCPTINCGPNFTAVLKQCQIPSV